MREINYGQAISEAMHEEMVRDGSVIILGEDMGVMGSVFGLTKGFMDEFGAHRVIDTQFLRPGLPGWLLAPRCGGSGRLLN